MSNILNIVKNGVNLINMSFMNFEFVVGGFGLQKGQILYDLGMIWASGDVPRPPRTTRKKDENT